MKAQDGGRKARGGRQDVLAAVEAFESRLTRYALRLLGDLDLARDAVQHTFVQLCDEPPRSSPELAGWLFTVCRNKAYDHLRRNSKAESLDGHPSGELLASREPDPADAASRGDLHRWVREQTTRLPVPQREVLALWSEGFSYREIAGITARTEGNIRVLVHRALSALRSIVATQELTAGR
jgi:RNA polymerase sigma factor (sigma-70 family)